jgi:hypothetical protein
MAVAGDATSYWIGVRAGPHLFNRPRSRFFRPEHVKAAHEFYERHGGKAIILARFMPLVRTFVPVVAGVAGMTYRRFAAFNVIGGAGWVLSMTLLGYVLGTRFPVLVRHIEKVIVAVAAPGDHAWLRRVAEGEAVARPAPAPGPTRATESSGGAVEHLVVGTGEVGLRRLGVVAPLAAEVAEPVAGDRLARRPGRATRRRRGLGTARAEEVVGLHGHLAAAAGEVHRQVGHGQPAGPAAEALQDLDAGAQRGPEVRRPLGEVALVQVEGTQRRGAAGSGRRWWAED